MSMVVVGGAQNPMLKRLKWEAIEGYGVEGLQDDENKANIQVLLTFSQRSYFRLLNCDAQGLTDNFVHQRDI